ncbi:hypothetical protein GEMRC1_002401 [Eukaryota sp. GEM-RC1]
MYFDTYGYLLLLCAFAFCSVELDIRDRGQAILKQLQYESQSSLCVSQALQSANMACSLSEDDVDRLAISLTNCHLQKGGFKQLLCNQKDPISQCLQKDKFFFEQFTHFKLQTQHLCFFLQSERLQQRAYNSIASLFDSIAEAHSVFRESADAVNALKTTVTDTFSIANDISSKISDGFDQAIDHHKTLLESIDETESQLAQVIEVSSVEVNAILKQVIQSTSDIQQEYASLVQDFSALRKEQELASSCLLELMNQTSLVASRLTSLFDLLKKVDSTVQALRHFQVSSDSGMFFLKMNWIFYSLFCFVLVLSFCGSRRVTLGLILLVLFQLVSERILILLFEKEKFEVYSYVLRKIAVIVWVSVLLTGSLFLKICVKSSKASTEFELFRKLINQGFHDPLLSMK